MLTQMKLMAGMKDYSRTDGWKVSRSLMLTGCVVALLGSGIGCASKNESNVMRGTEPLPALEPRGSMVFTGDISVHGLDRTDWPTQTIYVSVNDLESGRLFGTWWNANDDPTRRAAGLFPTHESALDLGDRSVDVQSQYAELFLEPVHQFVNSALIPVFLVTKSRPGTVSYGPTRGYTRAMPVQEVGLQETPVQADVDE